MNGVTRMLGLLLWGAALSVAKGPVLDASRERDLAAVKCIENWRVGGDTFAVNFARFFVVRECSGGTRCVWLLIWEERTGRVVEGIPSFATISRSGRRWAGARFGRTGNKLELQGCFARGGGGGDEVCETRVYELDGRSGRFRVGVSAPWVP